MLLITTRMKVDKVLCKVAVKNYYHRGATNAAEVLSTEIMERIRTQHKICV